MISGQRDGTDAASKSKNSEQNPSVIILDNPLNKIDVLIEEDYEPTSNHKKPAIAEVKQENNPVVIKSHEIDEFHHLEITSQLPVKARPLYDFAFENIEEVPEDIRKDPYFVYEPKFGTTVKLNKSFHTTASTHKTNDKKTEYIVKFNPGAGWFCDYEYMPQIESALTEVAAYYIGRDLCSVAYPIYNSKHKYVGVAVRKFKDLKPNKTHPLTREEVKSPKKKKQLAKILHWKFVLNDADANANNIGNYAYDWDLAGWKKTFLFKRLNPYEAAKRNPRPNTFAITADDIRNFPDLKKAEIKPWVTKKPNRGSTTSSSSTPSTTIINFITSTLTDTLKVGSEIIIEKYKHYYPETDHEFSDDQQNIYKDLAKDELFMTFFYIEVLRNCLSVRNLDDNAFQLHTLPTDVYTPNQNGLSINAWYSNDVKLANQKLSDMYANDFQENRLQWRDVTTGTDPAPGKEESPGMQEFHDFLDKHGEEALKEICTDFEAHNERYKKKIADLDIQLNTSQSPSNKPEVETKERLKYKKERYQAMHMDIAGVKLRYQSIFATAKRKKDIRVKAQEAMMKEKERLEIKEFDFNEFENDHSQDLKTSLHKKNN